VQGVVGGLGVDTVPEFRVYMDERRIIVVTVHVRTRDLLSMKREPGPFRRGVDSRTFVGVLMNICDTVKEKKRIDWVKNFRLLKLCANEVMW
jgi:hypothetical protein